MSVLVFIDHADNKIKKGSLEAAFYGSKIGDAQAVVLGELDAGEIATLGEVGISKVHHDSNAAFNTFDSRAYTKAIAKAVEASGASTIVVPFNQRGKSLAPRVAANLKAGFVPGAIALPDGDTIRKGVFSGKAFANYKINSDKRVIGLTPNSLQIEKSGGSAAVEAFNSGLSGDDFAVKVVSVEKLSGDIPLTEAELVVSGGRGLKGPENWGMIEDMAGILGAATACSRAVADVDWRPHHEHVGQTGLTIRPNLYIAIAISGAIQHLAGVNSSKTIVVINTDPEAPFFKAADYGIVGDAFEVVPKLNEALRKFKASAN